MRRAIHCQYLPSFSTHAGQLFYCTIHDTCTVGYYTYSPGIDAVNKFFAIQRGSSQRLESSNIFRCCLTLHLGIERLVQLKNIKLRCLAVASPLPWLPRCVGNLVGIFHCYPHSLLFFFVLIFMTAHTCLTQTTSFLWENPYRLNKWIKMVFFLAYSTSNRPWTTDGWWALCPSSVCIKLSSFVTLGSVSTWLV